MLNKREFLKVGSVLAATTPLLAMASTNSPSSVSASSGAPPRRSSPPAGGSTTTEQGNIQLIDRRGVHWAWVDNTGTRDVGGEINALIEAHWNEDGLKGLPPPPSSRASPNDTLIPHLKAILPHENCRNS
jgi:hypothetical protein